MIKVLSKIYEKALANPQRVAFPEALNERMLQAAFETGKEGYIHPILVGDPQAITAKLAELVTSPRLSRLLILLMKRCGMT